MNQILETWNKLPTWGKVALGAGVVGIGVYVWKSGSGSGASNGAVSQVTAPTDTTPVSDGGGYGDTTGSSTGDTGSYGSTGGSGSVGNGGTGGTVTPTPAPTQPPVVVPTSPIVVTPPTPSPTNPSTPHTPVGVLMGGTPIVVNPSATSSPAPADASHIVGNMTSATSQANSNVTTQVVGYQSTNKWSNVNGTYFVTDKTGKVVQTFTGQNALFKAQAQAKKTGGKSLEYALPGQ